MDPNKQLNQLDPKLKEAYDRVMGTDLSSSAPQSAAPAQTAPLAPTNQTSTPPSFNPNPTTPVSAPSQPSSSDNSASSLPPLQSSSSGFDTAPAKNPEVFQSFSTDPKATPVASVSSPSTEVAKPEKSKSKISPIILIIVGLFFFVLYALVWAKIVGVLK